jgi:protein phosphatase
MLQAFGVSDPGCVRSNNEDYYLLAPSIGLYVVADGMGGAQAGEHASRLAAETVWEIVYNAGKADENTLISAFEEANRRVMTAASSDPSLEGMGTTLTAALENGSDIVLASVGDTRAYLWDTQQLHPVTDDQTWVNEVGRRLGMDEEQLRIHPMRHVLTMAIGVSSNLRIHTYTLRPTSGMTLLICSDGLHGVANEQELVKALSSSASLEEKAQQLITAAREAGGPDNITCVLLQAT